MIKLQKKVLDDDFKEINWQVQPKVNNNVVLSLKVPVDANRSFQFSICQEYEYPGTEILEFVSFIIDHVTFIVGDDESKIN